MKRLISVLCSVVAAVFVMAQNVGDEGTTLTPNRLGLVYENAISENVAGRVNIHRVNYQVEGISVVANVYTPAGYDPKKSYAAVGLIPTGAARIRWQGSMLSGWPRLVS